MVGDGNGHFWLAENNLHTKIKAMLGIFGEGENICDWLFMMDQLLLVSLHKEMTKLLSVRGRTLQLEHRLLNHL